MIEAQLSPVAPRVRLPWSGDVIPLVDAVESLIQTGKQVSVQLDGENTSAAIQHLAAKLADQVTAGRLLLEDKLLPLEVGEPIVIVRTAHESTCDFVLRLRRWTQDDFIEYLLAKHPQQCASVMARLKHINHRLAGGSPTVWQVILSAMARDESKIDIEAIISDELHLRLGNDGLARSIADRLLFPTDSNEAGVFGHRGQGNEDDTNILLSRSHSSVRNFLQHEDVRTIFAMARFIQRMRTADNAEMRNLLSGPARIGRWRAVAKRIAGQANIEAKLQALFDQNHPLCTSHCATLLAACQSDWRPRGKQLKLYSGRFQNVAWPDIDLRKADLRRASFAAADLRGARLGDAQISGVDFSDAKLSSADFTSAERQPEKQTSQGSLLSSFKRRRKRNQKEPRKLQPLASTHFHIGCSFVDADLTNAELSGCRFRNTDFRGADLKNCVARRCELDQVRFNGADLTGAIFTESIFKDPQFTNATIDRCEWGGIRLVGKLDMDGMRAEQVTFAGSKLPGSSWTGSVLSRCDFAGADLSNARLAEIDWDDCDLRDVDLRGATFHLGSTRCGLVDSPYPSHGTRTGFYTDEYDERYFQHPESIRKASLVGADLRGARFLGVDFYLVDLRGAKLDELARDYLLSAGAILDD